MKILALDLATCTGWASGTATPIYGHETFKEAHRPAKLCLFGMWLENLLNRERPDLVGYEIPFLRGEHANALLKGMAGITEATAYRMGAAVAEAVRPMPLKKFWTGSGKSDKAVMIAECVRRGFESPTEDEADAIALWHWLKANAVQEAA